MGRLRPAQIACVVLAVTLAHFGLLVPTFAAGRDPVSGPLVERLSEQPPAPPSGFASQQEILDAAKSGKIAIANVFALVPGTVQVESDVVYKEADGVKLKADIYRPRVATTPRPLLIFIHGGAWQGGTENDYKVYCQRFAGKGYVAASISYRLSKQATFPAANDDVRSAVKWFREHADEYHIDPQHIALIGGSAGGHLAMLEAYSAPDQDKVQAVVNLYGPCDLTTEFAQRNGVVKRFLGKTFEEAPELYRDASPMSFLSADDPPTLVLHGSIDDTVPIEQSDRLADRMDELGVPYLYDRLDGWAHTMDLAKGVHERCLWFMDQFLTIYLPLPSGSD